MTLRWVEHSIEPLTISALYLPPKFTAKQENLQEFYNTLTQQFIAGGDYDAKHTVWGSRLITPRGAKYSKQWEKITYHTSPPVNLQTTRSSWRLCHKMYHPKFRNSQIMLNLSSDHSTVIVMLTTQVQNKRETAVLKQQVYKFGRLPRETEEDI
jgi:hypothetical protein